MIGISLATIDQTRGEGLPRQSAVLTDDGSGDKGGTRVEMVDDRASVVLRRHHGVALAPNPLSAIPCHTMYLKSPRACAADRSCWSS